MSITIYGRTVNKNDEALSLMQSNITEIKGLEPLGQLKRLYLSENQIAKIQGLVTLVNLDELYLFNNKITKIQGLATLVNLTELDLSKNKITKIEGLDTLVQLQILYLSENQITEIQGLNTLVNLTTLDLSNNKITKIQGLDALVNLLELFLGYNQITKIQGLDALVNLDKLDLSYNKITKMQGLDSLINLLELFLSHNQITDVIIPNALENIRYVKLDYNRIYFIPDISMPGFTVTFEGNPGMNTPQRRALEAQVSRYRGKHPQTKNLVPPKEATEWMNICRNLDQNFRLEDLKEFARTANITLSMDGKPKQKRQLCVDLAQQYTRLQRRTRHKSGCDNDSDLTGDDFDTLDPREYVRMPGGYCLSLADIAGLAPDFFDPFKRGRLPENVIKYYKENKHLIRDASGVHELKPVGQAYKHQEIAIRLTNILNSTERKVDGRVEVVLGETKYFDVGRLLVDKGTIDEYRRVIKRQKLIQDLQLEDYFRIGAPIVEYYDAMVDSLKRVKETRFDLLETLKWLYIEVMKNSG